MNKKETRDLFAQGRDAWNAWAAEMVAERERLEAAGENFSEFPPSDAVIAWRSEAAADFSEEKFADADSFAAFKFPGAAIFRKAVFSGYADFEKAVFSGTAVFPEAVFSDYAFFSEALFETEAYFNAIKANSAFLMVQTRFLVVPEFLHADFKSEAPRLDTCRIQPRGFRAQFLRLVKGEGKGNPNGPGRWRVLQKLADDGHDHISEQRFFRGELLARRGLEEPWKTEPFGYLISLLYQITSNFGSSLILPVFWWIVTWLG
jgi:hypothetical protein